MIDNPHNLRFIAAFLIHIKKHKNIFLKISCKKINLGYNFRMCLLNKHWRNSSVGQSSGIIIRRSWVRIPLSLPKHIFRKSLGF